MKTRPMRSLERILWVASLKHMLLLSAALALLHASLIAAIIVYEQSSSANAEFLQRVAPNTAHVPQILREANRAQIIATLGQLRSQAMRESFALYDTRNNDASSGWNRLRASLSFSAELPDELIWWIVNDQGFEPQALAPRGEIPLHWQRALAGMATDHVVIDEPTGSHSWSGSARGETAATLLIRVDDSHAVALISPTEVFTDADIARSFAAIMLAVFMLLLALFMSVGLAAGAWVAWRDARRIAAPLAALRDHATALERDNNAVPQKMGGDSHIQITEIAQLAQAIDAMAGALRGALMRQRELLSNISHDLRTPLTNLLGYTEVLRREQPDLAAAKVLASEAETLKRMVNDIFTLARSQESTLALTFAPTALLPLLHELRETHAVRAWQQGVVLRIDPASEALKIVTDPQRLRQVLQNLIDNALAHTPAGGYIELGVKRAQGDAQISVEDSGDGIDPTHLAHVFERSWRADPARSGAHAGFGLAICKTLVEALGGSIGVQSSPGQGSVFLVLLKGAPPAS